MRNLLILLLALVSTSLGCGGGDDAEGTADADGPVITPAPKGDATAAFNDGLDEISAAEFERAENVNLEWANVQPASHEKPAERGTDWENTADPPKRIEQPRIESDVRELPSDPFSVEPGGKTLPSADYLDDPTEAVPGDGTSAVPSDDANAVAGQTLPSPYYLRDDVQFFPAGPEFKVSDQVQSIEEYREQQRSDDGEAENE